jgi:hypothetical protein
MKVEPKLLKRIEFELAKYLHTFVPFASSEFASQPQEKKL